MVTDDDFNALQEIAREENKTLCFWLRHILLVISPLLGILISLQDTSQCNLYARLCFALACILLALGMLGLFVALYSHSAMSARSLREAYSRELQDAVREHRSMRPVGANIPKYALFCEKAAYACIGIAFLLLAVYSLLIAIM